jgi:hypothetical protein
VAAILIELLHRDVDDMRMRNTELLADLKLLKDDAHMIGRPKLDPHKRYWHEQDKKGNLPRVLETLECGTFYAQSRK